MGVKILLVEDDELSGDMLSRRLKKNGYKVVIATSGEEAMQLAQTVLPELILMDMGLPVMDGWEATRQLKKNAKTKHVPVLALTAYSMEGDSVKSRESDRSKAIKAGCDDYDTKPIEFQRLIGKIEKLLKKGNLCG